MFGHAAASPHQPCRAATDSQLAGGKARHAAGMEAWRLLSAHAWLLLGVRYPVSAPWQL